MTCIDINMCRTYYVIPNTAYMIFCYDLMCLTTQTVSCDPLRLPPLITSRKVYQVSQKQIIQNVTQQSHSPTSWRPFLIVWPLSYAVHSLTFLVMLICLSVSRHGAVQPHASLTVSNYLPNFVSWPLASGSHDFKNLTHDSTQINEIIPYLAFSTIDWFFSSP